MNKAEFTYAVSDRIVAEGNQVSMRTIRVVIDAALAVLTQQMVNRLGVTFVGFGSFGSREARARVGRNPRTGEEFQIASRWVPVFRAGKSLKDVVRGED